MSGTASIGRRWKFHAPKATAPSASSRTSQRCGSETAMRRSIMLGLALAHLRLHDEAVFRALMLAARYPGLDLDMARVGIARLHRARLDLVAVLTNAHDRPVLQRLD